MSTRFTEIEGAVDGRRPLEAGLDAYPGLRAKVEGLVDIIENAGATSRRRRGRAARPRRDPHAGA